MLMLSLQSSFIAMARFCWGKTPQKAVETAVVLEEVAFMQYHALGLNPQLKTMQKELLDKHYLRKHGKNAYYGQ